MPVAAGSGERRYQIPRPALFLLIPACRQVCPPDLPDYFVSIELRTKGGHSPEIGGLVFRVTGPEENIIISRLHNMLHKFFVLPSNNAF